VAAALVIGLSQVPTASGAGVGELAATGSALSGVNLAPSSSRLAGGAIPVRRRSSCRSARLAVAFYRDHRVAWLKMRGAATLPPRGRRPRNCADARYLATVARSRSFTARQATETWLYEFAWWTWLPANWQALGACETGSGVRPGNWRHSNARFVSAFGISRVEYDRDAAVFGGPPWSDAHPPTPHDQYDAARGHLARFGDGWGCPGP
jgi:hypothetical protein